MLQIVLLGFLLQQSASVDQVPNLLIEQQKQRAAAAETFVRAARKGDVATIRSMDQTGFEIGLQDSSGETALIAAANSGQRISFSTLLGIANDRVRRAVVRLPAEGQPAVVASMSAVNWRKQLFNTAGRDGSTPLMLAARNGWNDLVLSLVEGGAVLNTEDRDARRAVDYAEASGHTTIADYLRLALTEPR